MSANTSATIFLSLLLPVGVGPEAHVLVGGDRRNVGKGHDHTEPVGQKGSEVQGRGRGAQNGRR